MTRDDIIRMAREAGFSLKYFGEPPKPYIHVFGYGEALERFAALVAAAEREACIDLVAMYGGPVDLEAAIRARGQA